MNHPGVAGRSPPFPIAAAAAAVILCWAGAAQSAPVGGQVAAGTASIATTGAQTTITQATSSAVINWTGFGIGAGESVQFNQPGSSSVTLNRVIGSDPSAILGNLSANGKVFLVNPHGVFFGKGASVAVGGLVASTLDIRDADFMAGRHTFSGTSRAAVRNEGTLRADGGYVVLIGADVANHGTISARQGSVALAAGEAVTLDLLGDKLLQVQVDRGALNAVVRNGGLIQADGGQVLLTAQGAGSLLSTVVNNTGVIQARTISTEQGVIRLLGDMDSGVVSVGGTLDVSGAGAGQTGGSVTATGHHVGLFSARIDASGDAGGGTVLVGGGFQGQNLDVPNAAATYMSADSSISADATARGTGGTVVLWSDGSTRAYGSITARGGPQGGDGGLIETSGHWLDVEGIMINASGPNGKAGTWLLDPADITIDGNTTAGIPVSPTGGVYAPNSSQNSSILNVTNLRTALETGTGTNVTITTTNSGAPGSPSSVAPFSGLGDITIASALTWTAGVSATLTLNAGGDVNINAAVSATNGNLVVCCGRDINVRAAVTTDQGSILLSAGRNITQTGAITTTNGNITMCAGSDVSVLGKITLVQSANVVPALSLGLAPGLVLSAGNAATGPGIGGYAAGTLTQGGIVILPTGAANPLRPTVTGQSPAIPAPITISYNATSYLAGGSTDYSGSVIDTNAPLTQFMLVFPEVATKFFDNTTTATLTGLKGAPAGVSLNPGGIATFDSAAVGVDVPVTFSGLSLTQAGGFTTGGAARNFALPTGCCGVVTRTTGTILAAAVIVPPVAPPPVPVPVVVVPPPVVAVAIPDGMSPFHVNDGRDDLGSAPFVVTPVLLRNPAPLMVVRPQAPPMMALVVEDAPIATPVAPAPATPVAAPAPAAAPAAPYVAPARPARPYRN